MSIPWITDFASKVKSTIGLDKSEAETRKRVLGEPGPDLLIPLLRNTSYKLVIEDFHYLSDIEKVLLFQQWKRFVDNEVSVLVLGTTHRAVDIANRNRDLLGRIEQIDVGHWDNNDLSSICEQGFKYLKIRIRKDKINQLSSEAVGLPIIVQQLCYNLITAQNVEYVDQISNRDFNFTDDLVLECLHRTAITKYAQFDSYYNTLIRGPREKTRKYKTYELVLLCFTLDPIKFSLNRFEIDQRMGKLNISTAEVPPAASLNSTLGALKKFQERRGFELLEWRPNEEILYIIEPSFLFYVRWRKPKEARLKQLDLFERAVYDTYSFGMNNLSKSIAETLEALSKLGIDKESK